MCQESECALFFRFYHSDVGTELEKQLVFWLTGKSASSGVFDPRSITGRRLLLSGDHPLDWKPFDHSGKPPSTPPSKPRVICFLFLIQQIGCQTNLKPAALDADLRQPV